MSPALLPSIPTLRRTAQSLAMLDAILCPEWEDRYYSFNAAWGTKEQMASMRNGCGDDWFLLFDPAGAALKGYAHELEMDEAYAAKIQSEVPPEFASFLNEPSFCMTHATFCYWRRNNDLEWSQVNSGISDTIAEEMLDLLISGPSAYQEWIQEYLEKDISLDGIVAIFNHSPLHEDLVKSLNPEADMGAVLKEAAEIGYPKPIV